MQLLLLPLFGPLHLRWPALNTVTMRDQLAAFEPAQVFTTVLRPEELTGPGWQDTFELALPLSIVPWLRQRGLELTGVREEPHDREAADDFRRYASEMPALQEQLRGWLQLEQQLTGLLGEALTPERLNREALPLLRELRAELLEAAGDGPATGWLEERAAVMVERVLRDAGDGRVALIASADEVAALEAAFRERGVEPAALDPALSPSAEARQRGLLDYAMLTAGEEANPALEEQLADLGFPEAEYLHAGLLMGRGEHAQALRVLEGAANRDFSDPYYLPGFLLARLGQLRDAAGDRDGARKAYRAVLALSFVPQEARETAEEHMAAPFVPPQQSG
ncbi:MAG TPA: hypothetical protein VK092_09735 [Deinococcales bacterium]|nr:hypothetical protein [Deinococcales bacterium]